MNKSNYERQKHLLHLTAAAITGLMSRPYCDTPESLASDALAVAKETLRLLELNELVELEDHTKV